MPTKVYSVFREDDTKAFERAYGNPDPEVGEHVHIDDSRIEDVFIEVDHQNKVIRTRHLDRHFVGRT